MFSFKTFLSNAELALDHQEESLFTVNEEVESDLLLSDVTIGLDGSIFVSDWNSANNRRGERR